MTKRPRFHLFVPQRVDTKPIQDGLKVMERIRRQIIADRELRAAKTPPPRSTVQH